MFLFLVILAAIALIVMLRWPSLYTVIIFAVIFVVTIIDIIFLGSETSDKEQEAKTTLKRRLEELISCWESNRGYHLKSILDGSNFQKELRELGNELKEAIGKDKLLLSQTIVVEAKSILDAVIDLAASLRLREVIAGDGNLQIYREAVAKGDKLVERVRELKDKLSVKNG